MKKKTKIKIVERLPIFIVIGVLGGISIYYHFFNKDTLTAIWWLILLLVCLKKY